MNYELLPFSDSGSVGPYLQRLQRTDILGKMKELPCCIRDNLSKSASYVSRIKNISPGQEYCLAFFIAGAMALTQQVTAHTIFVSTPDPLSYGLIPELVEFAAAVALTSHGLKREKELEREVNHEREHRFG